MKSLQSLALAHALPFTVQARVVFENKNCLFNHGKYSSAKQNISSYLHAHTTMIYCSLHRCLGSIALMARSKRHLLLHNRWRRVMNGIQSLNLGKFEEHCG